MNSTDIAHWRMHTLRLTGNPLASAEAVVGWLGAVQSQDYGPAKWSVAQRLRGATDADLERACADSALLRTHVLRPTWHFVLPADIGWLLDLTAPRVRPMLAYYDRQLELDDTVLRTCARLLVGALEDGRQRTRAELAALLAEHGIAAQGQRLGHILMHAELDGVICSGAMRGKQQTYALLAERAPHATRLDRDAALAELTRRYFTSHGPATAKDFGWWSSLTLAEIKRGLEMVGAALEQREMNGVTYWFAASDWEVPAAPTVHLLQGYDEYIVGYSESKYVLDVAGLARSTIRDRASFNGIVLLDGQVAGHWKRTLRRDAVSIEAALYAPFDAAQMAALHAAADRHGAYLGLPASVASRLI